MNEWMTDWFISPDPHSPKHTVQDEFVSPNPLPGNEWINQLKNE